MKSAWFAVIGVSCIQFFSVMSNPVFYPVFYPVVRGRRWIPDRFSNEDFGVDSSQNSGNNNQQSYASYFWPEYMNSGNSAGDYSGMLYRANDNVNHGSMDPVQQLHGVQAYSYAQMLRPYGYGYPYGYGRTLHEMQGGTSTDEDVGGRALASLGLIRSDLQAPQPGAALLTQQPLLVLVPSQGSEPDQPQQVEVSVIGARKNNVLKLRKNASGNGHQAVDDSSGEQEDKEEQVKLSQHVGSTGQRVTASGKTKKKNSNHDHAKTSTKSDSKHQPSEDLDKTPDSKKEKEHFRTHDDTTESTQEAQDPNNEMEETNGEGPSSENPLEGGNSATSVDDASNSNNDEDDESQSENGDFTSAKEAETMRGRSYGDPMNNPYVISNYGGSPVPPNLVYSGALPPFPLRPDIPHPYYRSPSQYPLPIYGYPSGVSDNPVPIYNLAPMSPPQYPFPYGPSIFPPNGYMPLTEPVVLNPNNNPGHYGLQPRRARQITYNWETVQPKHVSG